MFPCSFYKYAGHIANIMHNIILHKSLLRFNFFAAQSLEFKLESRKGEVGLRRRGVDGGLALT